MVQRILERPGLKDNSVVTSYVDKVLRKGIEVLAYPDMKGEITTMPKGVEVTNTSIGAIRYVRWEYPQTEG